MKNGRSRLIRSACFFAAMSLLASSCKNPLTPLLPEPDGDGKSQTGTASLTISVVTAEASRTVVPDFAKLVKVYHLTLVNGSEVIEDDFTSTESISVFGLAPAEYSLTLQAFSDAEVQVAQGTATVNLVAAGNKEIPVALSFTQIATGSFSLTLNWPVASGFAVACATLDAPYAGGDFPFEVPCVDPAVTGKFSATLSKSPVPSGNHSLYIYFRKSASDSGLVGPFVEAVNIWDNVESNMWVTGNGMLAGERAFNLGEFPSVDAMLAGFAPSGTCALTPAFSPSVFAYSWDYSAPCSFTVTARSAAQKISYSWNGVIQEWGSVNGATYTTMVMPYDATGNNRLKINVTAPDGSSACAYSFGPPMPSAGANVIYIDQDTYARSVFSGIFSGSAGKTYVLTKNISVATDWGEPCSFAGIFEGNGYTITFSGGTQFNALFVTNESTGIVRNLKISTDSGLVDGRWSGVFAKQNYGTIIGCTLSGLVNVQQTLPVGGFVGTNETTGKIIDCVTDCSFNVLDYQNSHFGAIAGYSSGLISGCTSLATIGLNVKKTSCGGIVGTNAAGGIVSDCVSRAKISVNSIACDGNGGIGGIAGVSSGSIVRCSSVADISGTGKPAVNIGGIAGKLTTDSGDALVSGCESKALINVTTSGAGTSGAIGGLAGLAQGASVGNLLISGNTSGGTVTVKANSPATCDGIGGFVGKASSSSSDDALAIVTNRSGCAVSASSVDSYCSSVGGFAGSVLLGKAAYISMNESTGDVSNVAGNAGTNATKEGGFVGSYENSDAVTTVFSGNFATGRVTGVGTRYTGGFAGWAVANTGSASIARCYATGTVSGNAHVGGFAGVSRMTIADSYSRGSVSGTEYVGGFLGELSTYYARNCYSSGSVTSTVPGNVGGFIGVNIDMTWSGCFFADSSGPDNGLGIPGSSSDMTTLATYSSVAWDIASSLSRSYAWGILPSINDGYPFLQAFGADTVRP